MLTARWKFRGDGLCSAWIRRSALESERVAGCRLHDAEERLRTVKISQWPIAWLDNVPMCMHASGSKRKITQGVFWEAG